MGINDKKYDLPATKGDVAGIAINASLGLLMVHQCLQAISAGKPLDADSLATLKECADKPEIQRVVRLD
ncbi:hypothetical protein [Mesorhizobium sp. 131-2-5]|uniref:hypothetical protein n=1 Tax=Mesorhizobium sp. 131-2-5 TaxID=2744519 RepID=UPI0019252863|nr:hypothetical protein [Mesorhizobium sp. 131-2-5]